MNIYDWVIVALITGTALFGISKGAVTMALGVIGVFAAMFLGGRYAAPLVRNFTESVDAEAVATVVGYIIISIVVFVAMGFIARFVRVGLTVTMLGWVDKFGGVALGLLVGFMLSIGLTMAAARYTYVVDNSPGSDSPTSIVNQHISDLGRSRLDIQLTESQIVPTLIDIRRAAPGDLLGLVPDEFNTAMDTLENRIQ